MELRVNNNNQVMPNLHRNSPQNVSMPLRSNKDLQLPKRKRDFRFQVIQVCQGPKWFVWPTPHKPDEKSDDEEDEEENKTSDQENNQTCTGPVENMQMQHPTQLNLNDNHQTFTVPSDTTITNGALTPVTATNQMNNQSPMSEPTTRRIAFKPTITKSEPISMSAPSATFKILSIAKKWNDSLGESDDEDYLDTQMAEEYSQMTLGGSLPPQSSSRCNCGCFN